jgi:hypothetical protein
LALFAPVEPPTAGPEKWAETQRLCTKWAEDKSSRLEEWKNNRKVYVRLPLNQYNAQVQDLLDDLACAGQRARESITTLEGLYGPTKEATIKQNLQSHIYVTSGTMTMLDEIYRKHYQSDGALALRRCFIMTTSSESSAKVLATYMGYLNEVKEKLFELSSSPASRVALREKDPRAFGLKYAPMKLEPLFGPVFGRISLPLPTRSMLDDLCGCLEVDEDIMGEVVCSLVCTVKYR